MKGGDIRMSKDKKIETYYNKFVTYLIKDKFYDNPKHLDISISR